MKRLLLAALALIPVAKADNFAKLFVGEPVVISSGHEFAEGMAFDADGNFYFTDPKSSAVWTVSPAPDHKLSKAVQLEWKPNGIGLHPKEDGLMVAEFFSDTVHRFPINEDGSLGESRPYYQMPVPREGKDSGKGYLDGMIVLPSNKLIIGTVKGIQFSDSMEALTEWGIIIPPFGDRPRCNYVRLSPDGRWHYAAFQHDLLKLRLKNTDFIELVFRKRSICRRSGTGTASQ